MTGTHKDQTSKPTQKTPKGLEIPVPARKEVDDALDKMAKSKPPLIERTRSPKK
jgi:hypothetical protein